MKMTDIRATAKAKGLNPVGKNKEALIREIQRAEKNRDCFNRGESKTCSQTLCTWRSDCN
jgi:hypothetical protein